MVYFAISTNYRNFDIFNFGLKFSNLGLRLPLHRPGQMLNRRPPQHGPPSRLPYNHPPKSLTNT